MSKKRLNKIIVIFLVFSALLMLLSVFMWKYLYLNPAFQDVVEKQEFIKKELSRNEYSTFEDLFSKLDSLPDISYNIEEIKEDDYNKLLDSNNDNILFSNTIKVDKDTYLLTVFNNGKLFFSDLALGFFKIHGGITLIVTLIMGVIIEKLIIRPLHNILFEIKNYKFGKKPKKNKIRNEIDFIQNEFVGLIEELDKEKCEQNRIIASVSHDLKTPLTSVIGYSNFILEKKMTKEQILKYNDKINLKAKNMKDILNNFDEYLANNNTGTLKLETIKISDLLNQLNEDYLFDLEANNIKFITESNCSNEFIKIDISKIRRIFSNIIDNSVRYIKTNGVIKVCVEEEKDFFRFIISDNGKGVDENLIDKIFDPLFTTDYSRKISGLGLSICKEFVEMHKGSIIAYNNLGLTIEFTIRKEQLEDE